MNCLPFDAKDAILHSSQVIFSLILVFFDLRFTVWMVYKFLGTKKLEYKGHQWHEQCFLCDGCKVPIGSNPFVPKESENFCSKCYEDRFANKCTKCTGVRANIHICFHFDRMIASKLILTCFSISIPYFSPTSFPSDGFVLQLVASSHFLLSSFLSPFFLSSSLPPFLHLLTKKI